MAYQYTNRCGDVYYIQAKERGAKIAYSATRKSTGTLLDQVPDGYEVYEHPANGQVFVRKVRKTKILAAERALVERAVRDLARVTHFIVDVEVDAIVVYVADRDPKASYNAFRSMAPMFGGQAKAMADHLMMHSLYSKMMRFVLDDAEQRSFIVERWCFLGSIDDWYFLSAGKSLGPLAKKFVPHLGRESFYELV